MPIQNPSELLQRLLKEPKENTWLEFKHNNKDPELIGKFILLNLW
jgi:ATP-dependent DNA helicase RecG